jgi:hypothetical protein
MSKLIKDGRTLYARDPNKNYAFTKVGEIGGWFPGYKSVWIDGKLYTLTPAE